MTNRIPPNAIEATGYVGDGSQFLADDGTWKAGGAGVESVVAGSGIAVDSTDPANPVVSATGGGGGGGGSPVVYRDDLGGTDWTTTLTGYTTVPGLSLSITPAVDSVFILNGRLGMYSSSSTNINSKVLVSPTPISGPAQIRQRSDAEPSNRGRTYGLNAVYVLGAGITYTFTVQAYKSTSGTLTVYGDTEQTELSGVLFPA